MQVLLSAMFLENEDYIDSLNIHTDCVVINQCDRECERTTVRKTAGGSVNVTYVETKERGLSKSRNMALSKADADICLLCDNDVEYASDYDSIVDGAFSEHPDADVIVFFIKRPERQKPLFEMPKRMGFLSTLKIFSPEIALRRNSIGDLRFNEMFGAGAKYFMGEENLFLYECLKRGMKIIYVPKMIAQVRSVESTWFKGYDRNFFISRGANYAAMSRMFSPFLSWQFALRKKSLYRDTVSTREALSAMREGRREYLKYLKGNGNI